MRKQKNGESNAIEESQCRRKWLNEKAADGGWLAVLLPVFLLSAARCG
jgi:hypothetical protein